MKCGELIDQLSNDTLLKKDFVPPSLLNFQSYGSFDTSSVPSVTVGLATFMVKCCNYLPAKGSSHDPHSGS
jgi:hypothetical protein